MESVTPDFALNMQSLTEQYNSVFKNGHLVESHAFYRWVLRTLRPQPGGVLVDVACGSGLLVQYASTFDLLAIGLDFASEAIQYARTSGVKASWLLADGHHIPIINDSADYVTNLGSLEHYIDIDQGVKEMVRILKPGGKAAILLPNMYYLGDILWYTVRKGQGSSHKQPIERFASYREWADVLERNNLQIISNRAYNFAFPTNLVDLSWYSRFPRKLINLLLGIITPYYLSYAFLFLCQKSNPQGRNS